MSIGSHIAMPWRGLQIVYMSLTMPSSSNGWSLYLFNIDVNVKHLIQLTSIQDIKSGNTNSHKTTHPANNFKRSISIFFLRNIFNYSPPEYPSRFPPCPRIQNRSESLPPPPIIKWNVFNSVVQEWTRLCKALQFSLLILERNREISGQPLPEARSPTHFWVDLDLTFQLICIL